MRQHLTSISIFFLSLFLFTWGVSGSEITGFDSRFYLFAKEMWHNGLTWFPTTYGQPYPDYPVISTLIIYFIAKLFGGLNKFIAVLPSALAAAWMVVLTYRIGALHDRKWGFAGVCFMLMTLMFIKCARSISLDVYPAMFTAWCFYLVYVPRIKRSLFNPGLKIIILLILSFAFRGPIGLVMPAGVVCSYYALNREWKKLIIFGVVALITLLLCTSALLAVAYHVGGDAFMQDVIRMQVSGRIDNPYWPIYFYFTNSFSNYALSYPIAIVVVLWCSLDAFFASRKDALLKHRSRTQKTRPGYLLLMLIAWTLVIMIGMSIPDDKKARYILAMAPAIALIAAYPFAMQWRKKISIFMLAVIALTLNVVYIKGVEPALLQHDKTSQFVTAVETLREKAHAQLVFYRDRPDSTPIKYQVYNLQNDNPIFIDTEQQLLNYKSKAFFITSEDYFSQLSAKTLMHFSIIARDKVGHDVMVVFVRRVD